jgi:CheY-like chemotaxis protein
LIVTDTGDGISADFLPYVFHRFRQEEGSISRKAGGLGLGLAVVRHLVELHGGNVSAESAGPGQGSTFTVDLPLAADRRSVNPVAGDATAGEDAAVVPERRSGDGIVSGDVIRVESAVIEKRPGSPAAVVNDNAGNNVGTTAAGGKKHPGQLAGIRVLLVEDDDDSRNLLSLVLGRYGARVISAASSAEALDSFRQTTPDIIISDIGMTEEDGYALLGKLRTLPLQGSLLPPSSELPDSRGSSLITHHSSLPTTSFDSSLNTLNRSLPLFIPAIALTGYATSKDRERAFAAGYQLHLAKPVEPEDLVAAIVNLVGQLN